jgi:hypothetical protein
MSCDTLHDALVDVARGRDAGAGTVAAVEAHIEHCTSCHARFTREVALSEELRALARVNASAGASAGVEATLLAAFADHGNGKPERAPAIRDPRPAIRGLWMRAAAAVAVLVAAGVAWWTIGGSRSEDLQPASIIATTPHGASTPPDVRERPRQDIATPTPQTVARATHPQPTRSRSHPGARIIRPDGFVALPSAAGLPAFESGEIVRVEVPLTSLPMYGIDIAPDARGPAVEADFLVGQDGQARAIRLVSSGRDAVSTGSSR